MTTEQMDLLLSNLSSGFFTKQVFTILFLFVVGVAFLYGIREQMKERWIYLLAYPTGLAIWCISGFLLLTLGIPFSLLSELITIAVILFVAWAVTVREHRFMEPRAVIERPFWKLLTISVVVLAIAAIATSGIISISISNDSMYYYMYYPEVFAKEGAYLSSYDVFLSDVGPMAALIGTIPALLGFDQFYGIQQVFQINFILLFGLFVYERAEGKLQRRTQLVLSIGSLLFLMSATPYMVVSKWILANVYVMGYSFILFGLAYKISAERELGEEYKKDFLVVMMVFSAMVSMLRMEGGMLMCFLILCISTLQYKNRELLFCFLIPASVMPCLYYIRYFVFLKVSPVYAFLTWQKAAVAVGIMILLGHYIGVIRGRYFVRLQKRTGLLILAGLLLANAGLFLIAPSDFVVVIRAFWQNFAYQEGWGYMIYLLIICYIVLFFATPKEDHLAGDHDIKYENLVFIGYILFTLAVSFARGGGLRRGIGDSGNRVMLQVVPFLIFALICKVIEVVGKYYDAETASALAENVKDEEGETVTTENETIEENVVETEDLSGKETADDGDHN